MTPDWTQIVLWLAVGYLFGAIPFGLILTRLAGLGDVRSIGSGNIGAADERRGRQPLAAGAQHVGGA
ncbi:glycerol-3-phosphate acyltransferase, partial [uncultured Methylobacterium sp.]|uniref:glycerol-3-phosphate acyltransferase n=1 Tax=uncultured Methylobacterium sp. TaxID=157278 RepID=UPI0025916241